MLKNALLLGTNRDDLNRLEDQLRDLSEIHTHTLLFDDSSNGSLRRAFVEADLVVLCSRGRSLRLLSVVDALTVPRRPPIIVCGDLNSPEATKLLVRIGADDLLTSTPTTDELQAAVLAVLRRQGENSAPRREPTTITILGAAGGVGGSFIACNLAHIFQVEAKKKTLIIDLDRAYAPISSMLGLKPARGIDDAISNLRTLDATALDGYGIRHDSGLQLISATGDGAFPRSISGADISQLLAIVKNRYDLIVIAANRWLDETSMESLAQSQLVLMTLRAELSDVRCAKRLRFFLTDTIGLHDEAIRFIVNRHSLHSVLPDNLLKKALGLSEMQIIPEATQLVRRSIDSGVPILDADRDSAVTRSLIRLANSLVGTEIVAEPLAFGRLWNSLSRSEKHP